MESGSLKRRNLGQPAENGNGNAPVGNRYNPLVSYDYCPDDQGLLKAIDGNMAATREKIGSKQQCMLYFAVVVLFLFALINILVNFHTNGR